MFLVENLEKLIEGIRHFNKEEFFECHEILENHWLEERHSPSSYVYWVVLQVATSLLHYQNSNMIGAREMLLKARGKLDKSIELGCINDLLLNTLNWQEFTILVKDERLDRQMEALFNDLLKFKFEIKE